MAKLLYIDACIRDEESRTKRIATPIINKLKTIYDVDTLILNNLDLKIIDKGLLKERMSGNIPEDVMSWANKVKDADRIVIAAPFWDMSFPAALKNFFELCSIFNVTFKDNGKSCYGNCKAKKMLYITTRGMDIATDSSLDGATPYLRALSWLWGIGPLQVISCQNMDYLSEKEINNQIDKAINEGLKIAENF